MSASLLVIGLSAFVNYGSSASIANRVDSVSGQKQITCMQQWKQDHPQYGDNVVFTWHGKQPNEQFVHTFDVRTIVNDSLPTGTQYKGLLINGYYWASVENFYQASKIEKVRNFYPDLQANGKYGNAMDNILNQARSGGPMSAFSAVRTKLPNGKDINAYFGSAQASGYITRQDLDDIMLQADLAKYRQYSSLRHDLFKIYSSGGMIVEASPRDSYWGIQMIGGHSGDNKLGKIHQQVSQLLKQEFLDEYPS